MSKLIFLLILFVFVLILSATPLFCKSRSQRDYESSGMQLLATSRGRVLLLPALGCLCACIVTFFMVLMYQDIGFEASDIGSLLSCIGITILLVVVCFLGGYAMQARHVLYNEEILLIGKPFRPYQTIHWFWHCFMSVCRKSPTTAKKLLFPVSPAGHKPCCAGISASLNVPPAVRGSGRSPCTRITADM